VVVVCVVGRSEKFSHGMVRSQKPLLMVPLHNTATTIPLLSTYTIQHRYIALDSIPRPPTESINDLTLTNEWLRINKRTSKYTAPLNPQGDRPRSMRSLSIIHQVFSSLDCDPRFFLSSFNGVVTLRKGLAGA
jgi:hypothetical protein